MPFGHVDFYLFWIPVYILFLFLMDLLSLFFVCSQDVCVCVCVCLFVQNKRKKKANDFKIATELGKKTVVFDKCQCLLP